MDAFDGLQYQRSFKTRWPLSAFRYWRSLMDLPRLPLSSFKSVFKLMESRLQVDRVFNASSRWSETCLNQSVFVAVDFALLWSIPWTDPYNFLSRLYFDFDFDFMRLDSLFLSVRFTSCLMLHFSFKLDVALLFHLHVTVGTHSWFCPFKMSHTSLCWHCSPSTIQLLWLDPTCFLGWCALCPLSTL